MSPRIHIRPAQASDYGPILTLNADAVPNVNLIDPTQLRALHEQATTLLVAHDNVKNLAGFLLALPETADYASVNFRYFKRRFDEFAYVDRIVVSPAYRRLGVGASLYARLFQSAANRLITCEVNLRPPNPGSMRFHGTLGFEKVGEQDTDGGRKRVALLARQPDRG